MPHVDQMFHLLSQAGLGNNVHIRRAPTHPGLFRDWFRREVPGPGASTASGVYFVTDHTGNVLYIGKATKNNMGAEVWGKFKAAARLEPGDTPIFANSGWAADRLVGDTIVHGDVQIHVAIIDPADASSTAEVYLQTWCRDNGGLPPLNRRVG